MEGSAEMADEQTTEQNTPQELPSDLSGLTVEELDQALADARAEAEGIDPTDPNLSEEQATRLEQLADFVEAVAARQDQIEQERAERTARAEAAAQRMAGGDDEGEPGEGDEGDEGESGDEGDGADEGAEAPAPEAVAASGGTPARPAPRPAPSRRSNPRPSTEAPRQLTSIVAAADVGDGIQSGAELDRDSLVRAFVSRAKAFSGMGAGPNVYSRLNVATVHRHFDRTEDGLWYGNEDFGKASERMQNVLVAAASERRLKGGSLVAAGGWCAPSENMYGIPSDETLDGILDLPTVGVDRGGINYTPGPDFADIYSTAGFAQTEAEAIAGTTKTCVEVDCPDFTEVRLDAVGFCVKAPLLTRAAYAEAIARWLGGTQVANQHKIAARLISGMRTALGTALAPTLTGTPITWGTLSIIEWHIEMERQAYRLSENEALEVVIPRWVKVAIRADLANRMGMTAAERVTDEMIRQHFADRGAAVQFVLNYLEVATPLTSVAFPASFEVMVYPAGTFVKGQADVVSLDTVYDTADLQTNVFTAAFVEDGVLLAKMKHGGKRITIPVLVNGMVGSPQLDDNLFGAQVENAGAAA